jgi:hypothetical protein
MPFFALIQVLASRLVVGIIAVLAVIGFGSVAEPPAQDTREKQSVAITLPEPIQLENNTPITEKPEVIPEIVTKKEEPLPIIPVVEAVIPSSSSQEDTSLIPTALPLSFATINTETQKALVNVLCSASLASPIHSITGSGVIISPKGVVITNAHVAQFLLLKDYPSPGSVECILRIGSPAQATYTAELLYIAPQWIQEHAEDILNEHATGTGENDYAFLHITGRTDPRASLPESFPFVALDTGTDKIVTGSPILVAAYPADFLEGISIQKSLYTVSSIATIGERFTFQGDGVDLFSLGGTVVSQGGSSGGAAVSNTNKLVGIIVTSTEAPTTAERDMRAITIAHINQSLLAELGSDIATLLSGNVSLTADSFNTKIAPTLTSLLLKHTVQ